LNQGIINIIVALLTIIGALVAAWVGNVLGRRTERRKKIRESLEEIYKLSNQVNVWVQVTLRFLYKEVDKTDYYRVVMPGEYLEDYAKEPECPNERLEMLISFDAPSLKKYLPEYMFIVSELREVRYIGRATLIGEKAQATLRGRPRGRLGTDGSGKGCVRGRPRDRLGSGGLAPVALRGRPGLLGSTQATGATLYIKSSRIRQM